MNLKKGIIAAERPFNPTLKAEKINYYDSEKIIVSLHIEVAVAEIDLEIICSEDVRIETAKPYLNHLNYAYLGFMYTEINQRGKRVNAKITEVHKDWCAPQDVFVLRLDVSNDNASANNMYEIASFKKHLINMPVNV